MNFFQLTTTDQFINLDLVTDISFRERGVLGHIDAVITFVDSKMPYTIQSTVDVGRLRIFLRENSVHPKNNEEA